jgi:hypothetical protein
VLADAFVRAKEQKSRGEPRLIARTWLIIASHGDRLPRLTLQAGVFKRGRRTSPLRFAGNEFCCYMKSGMMLHFCATVTKAVCYPRQPGQHMLVLDLLVLVEQIFALGFRTRADATEFL